jgi:hypothetical protein
MFNAIYAPESQRGNAEGCVQEESRCEQNFGANVNDDAVNKHLEQFLRQDVSICNTNTGVFCL